MKTYLYVPYAEHEEARRLGAKWDVARKRWFVENLPDLAPFLHWMPTGLTAPHQPAVPALVKPSKHKRPDGKKVGKYAAKKHRQAEYNALRTAMKEARSSSPFSN
jgi:hypothetical protein